MEALYGSYSLAGDLTAMAICMICWLALSSTYTVKQGNLILFYLANGLIFLSSIGSMIYHILLEDIMVSYIPIIYATEIMVYISMAITYFIFVVYLTNLLDLSKISKKIVYGFTVPVMIIFSLYKVIEPYSQMGFYIDENLTLHYNYNYDVFLYYYACFAFAIFMLLHFFKKRLIYKVRKCLQGIMYLSFLVVFIEYLFKSMTLICVSFTFPILGALFLFHYNAYDTKTGTLDMKSFNNYIKDIDNYPFSMFCLYLKDFSIYNNKDLSEKFIYYTEKIFKHYCMFRIADNRIVLVYKQTKNEQFLVKVVLNKLKELYKYYHIPYKLVYIPSNTSLHSGDDYIDLYHYICDKKSFDPFYECTKDDIDSFLKVASIKTALADICEYRDLDDPLIKIYCQPILNVQTNTYRNAELLMRIKVNGMTFYPNDFIPVAEKYGYIHTLSKIILNKACREINKLIIQGYDFDRISINFSTMELIENDFCDEILGIIKKNKTPPNKIAIEITESQDEHKYNVINSAITKLKKEGIKFYLDDFGTGYSNLQRIFKMPIDVIKFDRDFTWESRKDKDFFNMVDEFSCMFLKFGYEVLFEGVETEQDENNCKSMNATYLQGYKYSTPIEIKNLSNYFTKVTNQYI